MRYFLWILPLFFAVNAALAQFDLNKCSIGITESFSPRVLFFTENYLIRQAYNPNTLYIRNRNNYDNLAVFTSSPLGIKSAAVNETENLVAISDYDNTVKIFDISENKLVREIKTQRLACVMQWNRKTLYSGREDGYLQINNPDDLRKETIKAHNDIISGIALTDNTLYTISFDGYLKMWETTGTLKPIGEISLGKVLTAMDVSPEHNLMVIGTFDGSVFVLPLGTLKPSVTLKPHNSIVTRLKIRNGNAVFSSSFDKTLRQIQISEKTCKTLFSAKDYIINFDTETDKIIYSDRKGHIFYFNFQCKAVKKKFGSKDFFSHE